MNAREVTAAHVETLSQLSHGPVWDGNLVSKDIRDELFNKGFVTRVDGWNLLTREGVQLSLQLRILKT